MGWTGVLPQGDVLSLLLNWGEDAKDMPVQIMDSPVVFQQLIRCSPTLFPNKHFVFVLLSHHITKHRKGCRQPRDTTRSRRYNLRQVNLQRNDLLCFLIICNQNEFDINYYSGKMWHCSINSKFLKPWTCVFYIKPWICCDPSFI